MIDDLTSSPKNVGPHTARRPYIAIGIVYYESDGGKRVTRIDYTLRQFRQTLEGDERFRNELHSMLAKARANTRRAR